MHSETENKNVNYFFTGRHFNYKQLVFQKSFQYIDILRISDTTRLALQRGTSGNNTYREISGDKLEHFPVSTSISCLFY